jgi:hypothetical protein
MNTKTKKLFLILGITAFIVGGCTKDFEEINTNPNNPLVVSTSSLLTAAQKSLIDDMYDEWFSGRQGLVYAQYWSQRNYTSEDRYALRQTTNNTYWRLIYTDIMDLVQIINLNTDPATKAKMSIYGNNNNQIAVARIMKAWAMQMLTDAYGDIPYFNAFKGTGNPTPEYDKQELIYPDLLKELKAAVDSIDESAPGFTSGDIVYGGDMSLWKKFGNSLRLRVAMRMSKRVDPSAVIAEAVASGVFTSNDDNAQFKYLGVTPNNAPLYDAFWTSARNDFTVCKTLVDYLKGVNDTLNNKTNPFFGITDPRLSIYSRPRSGKYLGMPYGMPDAASQAYKGKCPSFYGTGSYNPATAPIYLAADYAPIMMDYAEVEFILSEENGWDQTHYINGITASMEYWGVDPADIATYIAAVPAASAERVMTQKYLALYMQGYQAWAEYRRTGFPKLLKPGEKAYNDGTKDILFTPLAGTDIPRRVTYPQQEYVVNGANVNAAKTQMGGDELSTKVWWDN